MSDTETKGAVKLVPIDSIHIDGGTQMRTKIDESVVAEYAEHVRMLPPGIAYDDGAAIWLAAGFHRYHAHKKANKQKMMCEVRPGTLRDAILFAAGDNAEHGLRRSNADKRKAVMALLKDEEWGKRSTNWIAEQCNVSDTLVNSIRDEIQPASAAKTKGRDGKVYPKRSKRQVPEKEPETTTTAQESRFGAEGASTQNHNGNGNGKAAGATATDEAPAKETRKTPPPPADPTDCEGNPLPDHKRLRAIFADAQIIKDAQAALTAFAKAKNILWASDSPAVESLKGQQQQIDSLHEQIRTKLRDYQFHAVCGECGGKGCAMCANMGAVTRMEWGRKRNVAEARKGVA